MYAIGLPAGATEKHMVQKNEAYICFRRLFRVGVRFSRKPRHSIECESELLIKKGTRRFQRYILNMC